MSRHVDGRDGVLVVRFGKDDLQLFSMGRARNDQIDGINGHSDVLVDMSGAESMTASGLWLLLSALRAAQGHRRMRLFSVEPSVQEFLHLTRMDDVFCIDRDEKTALAKIKSDERLAA